MSVVEDTFDLSDPKGLTVTTLDFVGTLPVRAGVAHIQLHDDLWRVTRADGEVLGYVERHDTSVGHRFTAKRMLPRQRRFMAVGDFWSLDDALDCFRF